MVLDRVRPYPTGVPRLLLGARKVWCDAEEARAVLGNRWPGPRPLRGGQCFLPGQAQNGSRAADGAWHPGLVCDPTFPPSPPCGSCGFLEPGRRAASAFPAGPGLTEASVECPHPGPLDRGCRESQRPLPGLAPALRAPGTGGHKSGRLQATWICKDLGPKSAS